MKPKLILDLALVVTGALLVFDGCNPDKARDKKS